MKVIEDATDKFGQSCIIFHTTDLRKIWEWLWQHYGGEDYKFGILIYPPDGWEEPPKVTHVYFLDVIAKEAAYYSYLKICDNCCEKKEGRYIRI